MKTISGSSAVQELQRRKIEPDKVVSVEQGLLLMWLCSNEYVCDLRLDSHSIVKQEGDWSITGGPYENTSSPQAIADELSAELMRA